MILTHGANSIERGDFVKIGDKDYKCVKMPDGKIWMAENLDYKFDVNGSQIPIGSSGTPTTPAAWYYDNNETDYGIDGTYKCGLLYNWYAVKYLDDNKSTLLPDGWHVPTKTEFDTLAASVGGASTAGTKLKALDNSVTPNWPSGWGGIDDYGFKSLPSGDYSNWGGTIHFDNLGIRHYCFTLTEYDQSNVYNIAFHPGTDLGVGNSPKNYAFSLRLVKD